MLYKIIIAISVAAAVSGCASLGSIGGGIPKSQNSSFTKDGVYYKNYNEDVIDGFCYSTEENLKDIFVVTDKKTIYSLDDSAFSVYKTNGLLDKYNIKAGDFIEVGFDVQRTTGGIAGVMESRLLKVYDCKKITVNDVFKNANIVSHGIWGERRTGEQPLTVVTYSGEDDKFICVSDGGKYYVYRENEETKVFDREKVVYIPVSPTDGADVTGIGVKVLCSDSVKDEDIVDALKNKAFSSRDDIMLIGFCSGNDGEKCMSYADELADAEYWYIDYSETDDDIYLCITSKQFEDGVTAQELGISDSMYENARTLWEDMSQSYKRTIQHRAAGPYDRDILIVGGKNAYGDAKITFDKDGRAVLDGGNGQKCGYVLVCTDGAFFDIF